MGRPVHFELHGDHPEALAEFYAAAFGWTIDRWGDQEYWLLGAGDGAIGGAIAPPQEHGQAVVLTMEVADLAAAVARWRDAGGEVVIETAPIPGVGTLAQVRDPAGTTFGLLEPEMRDDG
jgi:predicted enzyme related to lactoylglutathione lyase